MEISAVSSSCIKIKGKNATILVDPSDLRNKTEADAILLLKKGGIVKFPKVEGARLTVDGAGEYEIGGIKISAIQSGNFVVYSGETDGVKFVLGDSAGIEKLLSELDETSVLLANTSPNFSGSIVSSLSPSVIALYGDNKEALKILGKENAQKVSKLSIKKDKLPQESEIVSLG